MRNLRYYGLSKSEYVSCTDIIRSFNEKRMGFTADMGVLFLGGLLILSFVLPAIRLFRYAYGITAFVCACISFSIRKQFCHQRLTGYAMLFFFYAFATSLAIIFPTERATVFPIMLAVFPVVLLDEFWNMTVFNSVCCLLYCLLIFAKKKKSLITYEVFSAICSLAISVVVYYYVQASVVQGFLSLNKLKNVVKALEEARAEMKKKSETDMLSGLMNRSAFIQRISVNTGCAPGSYDAIGLLDIDCFKKINDKFGHKHGDDVIVAVSKELKDAFKDEDCVARLGGDEFILFFHNYSSCDAIQRKAVTLLPKFGALVIGAMTGVSVSIGIAYAHQESTFEELYRDADSAMYEAKANGGGMVVSHSLPVHKN